MRWSEVRKRAEIAGRYLIRGSEHGEVHASAVRSWALSEGGFRWSMIGLSDRPPVTMPAMSSDCPMSGSDHSKRGNRRAVLLRNTPVTLKPSAGKNWFTDKSARAFARMIEQSPR